MIDALVVIALAAYGAVALVVYATLMGERDRGALATAIVALLWVLFMLIGFTDDRR